MSRYEEQVQIGVVYYPEHWDEAMWQADVHLMKEAGVKVVRLAEFAWCRLEPSDGVFVFDWLDRAIDLFHAQGIQVVLCTPTNTPPRWLTDLASEILPVNSEGEPIHPGVRGHRCYNSPSLRNYGARVTEELAKHYADHPAVIGWQIDNEYWVIDCHCDACSQKFSEWARTKYGTLENVNSEWGTIVWSGEYSQWSQITAPHGGSPFQNPSYLLDFTRFQWDSIADFQRGQMAPIRKHCPNHFITHNFHTYPQRLNLHQIGRELDIASFDYYPNTDPSKQATSPYSGALSLDVTRGIKQRNFWIMEQLSGSPGCWFPSWRAPYPGFIRAHSWQAIAKGADTVVHFRWRSAAIGAEQYWQGLIDPGNVPGRRFDEFVQLCKEVNNLSDRLQGSVLRHKVAILASSEQFVAMGLQKQAEGLDYYENIKDYHRVLTKLGIGCDVVACDASLDSYRLVIAPSLYLMDDKLANSLHSFAASGGTLVLTMRSGVKELNNQHVQLPLPGRLASLAGILVEETDPLGLAEIGISTATGEVFNCTQWADVLDLQGAEAIAWYEREFYAGKPAVTRHHVGSGEVYYIGTHPEEQYLRKLLSELAKDAALTVWEALPEGVQLAKRMGAGGSFLFVMNLSRSKQMVRLTPHVSLPYTNLLEQKKDQGNSDVLQLEPYGVAILQL